MSEYYYILEGHEAKAVTADVWAPWFENARDQRRIARDTIGSARVSTVFLGINHQFDDGPPQIFETMIFWHSHDLDEWCERYSTWDEAVAGHVEAVRLVQEAQVTA